MNPYIDGKRHEIGLDLFVKGFSAPDLATVYHRLIADTEQDRLILETACLDEIDDEYNDGEPYADDDDIFEAVTVRRFSQTDSRLRALGRVFGKYLGDDITPGDAIIGKPKKSGLFATVTAQIPFSDGQVISIVFHSPDGNAKQIKPDDAIIAFRWLLNKRDITHVVSPEGEGEVSLEEVGKRISQLIAKNSARFQTTQKEIKEQRANLESLKAEAGTLETENQNLLAELRGQQEDAEDAQVKIDRMKGLVERQKEINSDLENKLAGLRAAQEAEAARAEAERVAAEEQAAKEQEAAVEKRRQEIEAEEARIEEFNRLRKVGETAVPGVRSQDMETAGKLWEMLQRNEMTQDEWDRYVEDLYSSDKAPRPSISSLSAARFGTYLTEKGFDLDETYKDTDYYKKQLADGSWVRVDLDKAKFKIAIKGDSAFSGNDAINMGAMDDESFGKKVDQAINMIDKVLGQKPEPEPEIEPAPETVEPETTEPAAETEAISILNDLLAGKHDSDSDLFGNMLDDAAAKLEAIGLMEKHDLLLNQVADYLTGLLEKEAA